jgi:uncharacterized protein (TIGR00255 family)
MTGYGSAEATFDDASLVVEVRSVNHRYLDVRVDVPDLLSSHALRIEQLARTRLERGRYSLSVRHHRARHAATALDVERARAAYQQLSGLHQELGLSGELPLTVLAAVPSLLAAAPAVDDEALGTALDEAVQRALDALDAMRDREGGALARDLASHLGEAKRLCEAIEQRRPIALDAMRQRLRERIERLLDGTGIAPDEGRLEQELAISAERSDVAEELARLASHLDQLGGLLQAEGPSGRRIDFLLQEMGRETNTIGAKSPDAPLTGLVVELKAVVSRLREQVQNVE